MVQYSGRVLHANIMEIEEEVRDSTECLLMKVKLERMKTLTTTKYSQHGQPILCITNLHIYLWLPTSPIILLSRLLLVNRDAVLLVYSHVAGNEAQADFYRVCNLQYPLR